MLTIIKVNERKKKKIQKKSILIRKRFMIVFYLMHLPTKHLKNSIKDKSSTWIAFFFSLMDVEADRMIHLNNLKYSHSLLSNVEYQKEEDSE